MKTPRLRNAIEMAEQHAKFDTLSLEKRANLAIGDSAKVCAIVGTGDEIRGERFWVDITAADTGRYQGKAANELSHSAAHGLYFGDLIAFDSRHIYDVMLQSEIEGLRRKLRAEMAEPGFENETLKPADENQL